MTGKVTYPPPLIPSSRLPPSNASSTAVTFYSPVFHSMARSAILGSSFVSSGPEQASYWTGRTLTPTHLAPIRPYTPRPGSPISQQGYPSILLGARDLSPLPEDGEDGFGGYTSPGIVQIPSPISSQPIVVIRAATPIPLASLLEGEEYKKIFNNIQSILGLTEDEKIRLIHYICANRNALFEKATSSEKTIRLHCHDHQLPRTVLVTPNKQIFVLLNQVVAKGDQKIAEGFTKKIKLCYEVTQGILATAGSSFHVEEITKEFKILSQFQGIPGILKVLEWNTYTSKLGQEKAVLITPYYKKGDLFRIVIEQDNVFSEKQAKSFLLVLAQALQAIHKKGIIHRDIKMENILVDEIDQALHPVLFDFSLAYTNENRDGEYDVAGTPMYFHPKYAEAYLSELPPQEKSDALLRLTTPSLDIWALGILSLSISNSEKSTEKALPWITIDGHRETCRAIANLKEGWLPEPQDPSSLPHLIWRMLQIDPAKQISLPEIIAFLQAE